MASSPAAQFQDQDDDDDDDHLPISTRLKNGNNGDVNGEDEDDDDHLPISNLLKNAKNGNVDGGDEDDDDDHLLISGLLKKKKTKKGKPNVDDNVSRVYNTRTKQSSKGLKKEESDHESSSDDDDDDDDQEPRVGTLVWVKSLKYNWRPALIHRRHRRGTFLDVSLFDCRNPRIIKCKESDVCCFEKFFGPIADLVDYKRYYGGEVPDFAYNITEALRELRKQFMAGVKCPCRGSSMPVVVNVEQQKVKKRYSKELEFRPRDVLRFVLEVALKANQLDVAESIYKVRHVSQCYIFRRYICIGKDSMYYEAMGIPIKNVPTDDVDDSEDSEDDPWRHLDEGEEVLPEEMEMGGVGPVSINHPSDHDRELETSNAHITGTTLAEKDISAVNGDGIRESRLMRKGLNRTRNDGVVGSASDATKSPLLSSHIGDGIKIHSTNKACSAEIRTDKQVRLGMDAKGSDLVKGTSLSELASGDNYAYPAISVGIASGSTSKSLPHLGDIPINKHPSKAAADKQTNREVGSKMVYKERHMEKMMYSQPDSDLSYIQREQLDSNVPVDLPLSSSIPPFQPSETSHVDKGARLDIRFPGEFKLPSKDELVNQFSQFGSLDASASQVFPNSHAAQVVFLRKLDGEAAKKYAKSNDILFGGDTARFWIARGVYKGSRQGTTQNTPPESLTTVGSSVPTTEERALTPPEPCNSRRESKPDISKPMLALMHRAKKIVDKLKANAGTN